MNMRSADLNNSFYQDVVQTAQHANYYLECTILAYQLFAQTTLWKIDPFTETLQNDTYRQELFERLKAKPMSGPSLGAAHLDPLYQYYENVNPRQGVFCREGVDDYVYFTPPAWTSTIRRVFLCYQPSKRERTVMDR